MNDYGMNQNYPITLEGAREETSSLLAKVLGITSLGFFITSIGVATAPPWGTFVGFIVVLGLLFCSVYFNTMRPPVLKTLQENVGGWGRTRHDKPPAKASHSIEIHGAK